MARAKWLVGSTIGLVLFICGATIAQEPYAIEHGRAALSAFREATSIPGISVAVIIDDEIVWSEGFGMADEKARREVNSETLFRLGSVSKIVTIAAVARLYEEGKLDLDAPIQQYVPAYPTSGGKDQITTRLLTGHLGGIRHYRQTEGAGRDSIDFKNFPTTNDALTIFKDDPLVAAPGSKYSYTTFGYTLISAVVEGASGMTFLDYLQEAVFDPLEMTGTIADFKEREMPSRTNFYAVAKSGRVFGTPKVNSSYKWAGGGLLSNAEDMARFGAAHLKPGYLKAETLGLMFTSQKTSDGKETGVGIGWRVTHDHENRFIIHHEGSISGGRSALLGYPDQNLAICLLFNTTAMPPYVQQTAQAIAEPFLRSTDSLDSARQALKKLDTKGLVMTINGETVKGRIKAKSKVDLAGLLEVDGEQFAITSASINEGEVHLVLLVPTLGLMPLHLSQSEERLTGTLPLDRARRLEVSMDGDSL